MVDGKGGGKNLKETKGKMADLPSISSETGTAMKAGAKLQARSSRIRREKKVPAVGDGHENKGLGELRLVWGKRREGRKSLRL